jgi:hypothetical protein
MPKDEKLVNGWRLSKFIKCFKILNLLLPLLSDKMGNALHLLNTIKVVKMEIELFIHIFSILILNINRCQSQFGGGDPENLVAFTKEQSLTLNIS